MSHLFLICKWRIEFLIDEERQFFTKKTFFELQTPKIHFFELKNFFLKIFCFGFVLTSCFTITTYYALASYHHWSKPSWSRKFTYQMDNNNNMVKRMVWWAQKNQMWSQSIENLKVKMKRKNVKKNKLEGIVQK